MNVGLLSLRLNNMRFGRNILFLVLLLITLGSMLISCTEEREHTAPAIYDRDSVPVMTTYGVNTLKCGFNH